MKQTWLVAALVVAPALARADDPYRSTVTGNDPAQHLAESAEAVNVYEPTQAKQESADFGAVLNRVPGINIARTGGLGSVERISLNGFSNDQVRIFWNGIPLSVAGFAFGLSSVPLQLVDRVEVYRGVVPVRFGADALGGAINLVSETSMHGVGGAVSFQGGSFDTFRGSASGHYRDEKTGLYSSVNAFVDYTKNDYDVSVQVPDALGRLHTVTVPRFHDAYEARGAVVDFGVVDRPWAKRLIVRAFYSDYGKDLQNNTVMTIPYGAARYGEKLAGASVEAQQPNALGHGIDVDFAGSFSHRITDFVDTSTDIYNWYGKVIGQRLQPGEVDGSPHDTTLWRDSVYARLAITARVSEAHTLRLSTTADDSVAHGVSRVGLLPGSRDPLAASRTLFKIVSGVEYVADLFGRRLQNIVFAKAYFVHAYSDELLTGSVFAPVRLDQNTGGAGDSLRVRIWRQRLYAKASYEYATRIPSPTELFGDGILVTPNGTLVPEHSHNANVSVSLDVPLARAGRLVGEVDGFERVADHLIVLLGNLQDFSYVNVYSARTLGVEGQLRWSSPGEWLALQGSWTYQDSRNTSANGDYAAYRGDRLPNTPWLFASGSARSQVRSLFHFDDALALTYYVHWVHAFYRDWSSVGAPQYLPTVPAQLTHALSLSYTVRAKSRASFAFDIDNLTNARVFDVYGVQRPGRAFYGKVTLAY